MTMLMTPYLKFSTYIDGDRPAVAKKAADLASGCASEEEAATSAVSMPAAVPVSAQFDAGQRDRRFHRGHVGR